MSFQNATIRGRDCDPEEYHQTNKDRKRGEAEWVVSSGMLREFGQCPARWLAGYNPPESDAKDWGSMFDTLTTAPKQFDAKYIVRPETYTHAKDGVKEWNNNATVCREWNAAAEADGKKPIKKAEYFEIKSARDALFRDSILCSFMDASEKQVWLQGQWKDDATGLTVPVQCLLDFAPRKDSDFPNALGDLKTTRSANPFVWSRFSSQRKYHLQAALYTDMWNAATGEERDSWCFILSENFPPYQTGRSLLSLQKLEYGRVLYRAYLAKYCKCLKAGVWPDYNSGPDCIQGWSLDQATKWDEAEAMNAMETTTEAPEPEEELSDSLN